MRILWIAPGYSQDQDDWAIPPIRSLSTELGKHHSIRIVALRYPPQPRIYQLEEVQIQALGWGNLAGPTRPWRLVQAFAGLIATLRRRPVDLIHAFWADEPGFLAALAGRVLKIPVIVSVMGGEFVSFPDIQYGGKLGILNPRLQRISLQWADRITVGSGYLKTLVYDEKLGVEATSLPVGVDTARFNRSQPVRGRERLPGGEFRLLQVGSLSGVKDHSVSLRAMEAIVRRTPSAHLHLVGDGTERPRVEQLIQELSLSQHVSLLGQVDYPRMPEHYQSADLCLLSSRHEAQGMVVLEAAACGRATIGTAVGILPELDKRLTVPVGDSQAMAMRVLEMINNPPEHRRLSNSLYRQVVKDYSLERAANRLEDIYRQVSSVDPR